MSSKPPPSDRTVDNLRVHLFNPTGIRSSNVANFAYGVAVHAVRGYNPFMPFPTAVNLSARPVRHRLAALCVTVGLLVRGAGIQGYRALHHLRISCNIFRLCAWSSGSVAT
jgi:hypothetical protein